MKTLKNKINSVAICAINAIANKKAEGFIDSGVNILISVVIGALLLAAIYPFRRHNSSNSDNND
jgi:hypothetical protein